MTDPKEFPALNLPPIRPTSNNTMNTDRRMGEKTGRRNIETIRKFQFDSSSDSFEQ